MIRWAFVGVAAIAAAALTGGLAFLVYGGLGAGVLGGLAAGSAALSTAFTAAATVALQGAQYLLRSGSTAAGSNLPAFSPQQQGPSPTPLSRTLKQADVPRSFIFGRTKTSGAYFFYESDTQAVTGANPNTTSDSRIGKYLYSGLYICDGPIDGFDGILCDDEAFKAGSTGIDRSSYTPDGNLNVFIPEDGIKFVKAPNYTSTSVGAYWDGSKWVYYPVTSGGTFNIKDCALIAFEPAIASESGYNSYILNNLMLSYSPTAMANVWNTTNVGKGITCLYTFAGTNAIPAGTSRIKYFPNGFPEWSVIVRGSRVYDPRDPSQLELDPVTGQWSLYNSTWKWSENPALIAGHFISWLINQGVTAITGVDWEAISLAADDCDKLKPTTHVHFDQGSSYEKFARLTGVFYFNTPPREFLSNIMAACDGSYGIDRRGRFTMWIGKWERPAVTFTETDIGGFTEEFVESATEAMNEIHVNYTEPRQNYQKFEAPIWQDLGSQELVGKRVVSLNLDMVPSPNQAYRLVQRMARRINNRKKLTLTLGPRGMLAIKQRVVGVEAPNFGISGVWRVENLQPEMTLSRWTITLREIDESVFADEPPPVDPVSNLKIVNEGTLVAPTYFSVTPISLKPNIGYIRVSADVNIANANEANPNIVTDALVQEQTLQFDVRYSVDSGFTWTQANIELSANVLRTNDLSSGTVVTVQCRWISLSGSVSPWSASQIATIP